MAAFSQINNRNSKHFGAIFFFAPMGILITDAAGKIAAVNPFALREFGYTENELAGKKIEILIPARFQKKHSQYHKEYIEKPVTRLMGAGIKLFALRKDGTEFPVDICLSNYLKGENKYTIAFVADISARKKTEAEIAKLNAELEAKVEKRTADLKETTHQLELSRDQLEDAQIFQKALLDYAGAIIIATDEKGIIKLFNPEASSMLGYSPGEVIDKQTPVLFHDKQETDAIREKLLQEFGITIESDFGVFVEKARRNTHDEQEYTYIRKDGSRFPVSLTVTAIRDYSGNITGFIGIAIDISERKRGDERLRLALEKEKELGLLKSRFVTMASHEFRTPLSTVLSSAYLAEKYTAAKDQAKREKHLQRIVSSVNMLTDILNDFLSIGRIEEGKIQVKPSEFNIKEFVTGIAAEIKNALKKQQKIRYQHTGSGETVVLDKSLLKHILMNLLSNASKFSAESTAIEIKTACTRNNVTLSVRDEGIGISKEDQKHLMERFFRGANAGNIQGTGLGLHIVAKYAELMDGAVQCKSELEKGTEFIITFITKTV